MSMSTYVTYIKIISYVLKVHSMDEMLGVLKLFMSILLDYFLIV